MKTLAILVVFSCFLFSCSHSKGLIFEDVRNVNINLSRPEPLSLELKFYNPNYHNVTIRSAASYIYINDQYIGRLQLDEGFKVRRLHSFYLPMSLNIDLIKEYPILQQYAGDTSVVLRLDGGSITAGKKQLCITTAISYEHRHSIKHPGMKFTNSNR